MKRKANSNVLKNIGIGIGTTAFAVAGGIIGAKIGFNGGLMADADAKYVANGIKGTINPQVVTKGHLFWKKTYTVDPWTGKLK